MDYGDILKRSWGIVWGNKFMLLLGFLAALGNGGGGGGNSNFSFEGDEITGAGDFSTQAETFFLEYGALILAAICFFALLGIVFWIVSLTSRGGLIVAAARIDAGETTTFGDSFRAGWGKIGRLVGMSLLLFLPLIFIVLVISAVVAGAIGISAFTMIETIAEEGDPTAVFGALGVVFFAICGLLCFLAPIGLALTGISAFAQRGIMLHDLGIGDSIRHGWQIFKDNLVNIIILAIIFIVIGVIVSFVAGIIMLPLAFLAAGPAIFDLINGESLGMIDIITLGVGGFVLMIFAAAINSIVTAFQSTAFTLAYQEFLNKKAE